jgi:predicted nuclease of predicted toxin-antitoxin system
MRLLVDVCLSPEWVDFFRSHGIDSIHWTEIGACDAEDSALFCYAQENGMVIFTHDLDFGTILAHTRSCTPSVVQARVQDPIPGQIGSLVLQLLKQFESQLNQGAIVTLATDRLKVRILPI